MDPPAGSPATNWLRTGDRGFISEDELFIVRRIKDMLIVRGRNHYLEDIEATVQKITRGRVAAIAISDEHNGSGEQTEQLVTIVELKKSRRSRSAGSGEKRCDCRHFARTSVCRSPTSSRSNPARSRPPRAARSAVRRASSSTGRAVRAS